MNHVLKTNWLNDNVSKTRTYFRMIKCPEIEHFVKTTLFEKKILNLN